MAYSKDRVTAWHRTLLQKDNFHVEKAKLSLIKRGITKPSALQIRLEILFLSHRNLEKSDFLGEVSEQELICLLFAAWGIDVKETAEILEIKEDSVHKVRHIIFEKLDAKNLPNAVFKANKSGIMNIDSIDFIAQFQNKKTKKNLYLQKNIEIEEVENACI